MVTFTCRKLTTEVDQIITNFVDNSVIQYQDTYNDHAQPLIVEQSILNSCIDTDSEPRNCSSDSQGLFLENTDTEQGYVTSLLKGPGWVEPLEKMDTNSEVVIPVNIVSILQGGGNDVSLCDKDVPLEIKGKRKRDKSSQATKVFIFIFNLT